MAKRSPRLIFTEEERALPKLERIVRKADRAAVKLEKAEAKIPKKPVKVKKRVVDSESGKVTTRLFFEEADKKRPPSKLAHAERKAPLDTVRSAVHRKLREEGCHFRSHIDGSKHLFTPESVIDTERTIGADIMMAFDECPPGQSDYSYAKKSLAMTQRWLDRCIKRFNETEPLYGYEQSLFPIVQGCTYKDLRSEAAKFVADKGADGNAIGGLAVGEPTETMYEMIEVVNGILPKDKPRYLMGVGTPQNILEAIERGVDMFDCVMPTRNGRNAMLFTYNGTMNMRNKKWEKDFSPIDPDGCEVDLVYTKAYLHHLFKAGELLAMQIASIHNLAFYLRLVSDARRHIMQGDFTKWKQGVIDNLGRRV